MIRKIAFAALLGLVAPSFARSVEIACYWGEPSRYLAGTVTELETLYAKPVEPAYFAVDADAGTVTNNDLNHAQAAVFPKLGLKSTRDTVKIIVESPNVKALQNTQTAVEITIDRFTLESTMILAVPSSVQDVMTAQWKRTGRCNERKL